MIQIIEDLFAIAKLRKAEFTVQDIQEMVDNECNIEKIISKHCDLIQERRETEEKLLHELNTLKKQDLDWKLLARRLFRPETKEEIIPNFSKFDEGFIEENRSVGIPKRIWKPITAAILSLTLIIGIVFGPINYKNQATLVTIFALSEVTFRDAWIESDYEDNICYAKVSTNPDAPIGYDEYFLNQPL